MSFQLNHQCMPRKNHEDMPSTKKSLVHKSEYEYDCDVCFRAGSINDCSTSRKKSASCEVSARSTATKRASSSETAHDFGENAFQNASPPRDIRFRQKWKSVARNSSKSPCEADIISPKQRSKSQPLQKEQPCEPTEQYSSKRSEGGGECRRNAPEYRTQYYYISNKRCKKDPAYEVYPCHRPQYYEQPCKKKKSSSCCGSRKTSSKKKKSKSRSPPPRENRSRKWFCFGSKKSKATCETETKSQMRKKSKSQKRKKSQTTGCCGRKTKRRSKSRRRSSNAPVYYNPFCICKSTLPGAPEPCFEDEPYRCPYKSDSPPCKVDGVRTRGCQVRVRSGGVSHKKRKQITNVRPINITARDLAKRYGQKDEPEYVLGCPQPRSKQSKRAK